MNGELEFSKLNGKEKDFLKRLYKYLVEKNILVSLNKSTKEVDIENKLNTYFDKLKVTNERSRNDLEYGNRLSSLYYANYVIKKDNIPDSYYAHLAKKYQDEGYGIYNLVNPSNNVEKSLRDEHANRVIQEQKDSLDSWLNYLMNEVSDYMPMWAKIWAFTGMLKIGNYDRESNKYMTRRKDSVSPFVPIDSEVLNQTIEYLLKYLNKEKIEDSELETLVSSESFAKIYGTLLLKKTNIKTNGNEGIWVKYNGFSDDYKKLYDSLQGYNTGWCTAGSISTAQEQLNGGSNYPGGDFYVYYSLDENGEYKIPRIAIRMDRNKIGEIRGVLKNQNLEPGLEDILDQKLQEFPDKDMYLKKTSDMKKLTEIYDKYQSSELTKDELIFLYETDSFIDGFGFGIDPRIDIIMSQRNIIHDYNIIFEGYETFKGDIDLFGMASAEGLRLPKNIEGNLILTSLKTVEGLQLPEYIEGNIDLDSIESAKNLKFPKVIYGNLYLSNLRTIEGLNLPDAIYGNLDLYSLLSVDGLKLPKIINGNLSLNNLRTSKGLNLPENIKGLYLNSLVLPGDLKLPKMIKEALNLNSLTTCEGLKLPDAVGFLYLDSLKTADGLKLPKIVDDTLSLRSLTIAKNVEFPKTVGTIDLSGLTSAEGLNLPKNITYNLFLNSLRSAKDLKLPEVVNATLFLDNLSINDLINCNVNIPNEFGSIILIEGQFEYDEFIEIYNQKLNEIGIGGR